MFNQISHTKSISSIRSHFTTVTFVWIILKLSSIFLVWFFLDKLSDWMSKTKTKTDFVLFRYSLTEFTFSNDWENYESPERYLPNFLWHFTVISFVDNIDPGKQLPFLFHPKYHLFVFPFRGDIWALIKFYLAHGLLIMVRTYTLNFHRTTLNGFSSNWWTISIEHKNGSCTVSGLVIAPSGALSR